MVGALRNTGRDADGRSLTPVIGVVLLFGLVAVASLGLMTVALEGMAGAEEDAETDRAEGSLVELKHTMTTASTQENTAQTVDLAVGDGGAIIRDETGSISIAYEQAVNPFNESITFGAVEYEGRDGTTIALEAGAVFRGTGAAAQLVSAPPIRYDNASNALTFPIMEAVGEDQLASDRLTVRSLTFDSQNEVVENEEVMLEIESKYWAGWEEYFVREVGERGVVTDPDAGNVTGTVTVNLGRINTPTPFENAVTTTDPPEMGGNAEIIGDTETGAELDPIDDEIDEMNDTASGNYTALSAGPITAGEYYTDSLTIDERVVDLADGDVTIVVDGDLTVTDEFRVENWGENELQVYLTGDLTINGQLCLDQTRCTGAHSDRSGNNEDAPKPIDPSHLQVYGTSSFQLTMGGGTYFEGVIYAPPGDHGTSEFVESGNTYIDGSLVIGTVEATGTPVIEHHDQLKWTDPDIGTPVQPPELTYLNLVYQEIEVGNE